MESRLKVISGATNLGEDDDRVFAKLEDGQAIVIYFAYGNLRIATIEGVSEFLDYANAVHANDEASQQFLADESVDYECAIYVADELGNQGILAWDCCDCLVCNGGLHVDVVSIDESEVEDAVDDYPELYDLISSL